MFVTFEHLSTLEMFHRIKKTINRVKRKAFISFTATI